MHMNLNRDARGAVVVVFVLLMSGMLFGQETIPTASAGPQRWEFDSVADAAGWALSGLEKRAVEDGVLKLTATVGNPMLFSPLTAIAAESHTVVTFRLKLGKGLQSKGCLLFTTDAQPKWSDATLVTFSCQADGEFHTYEVDLSVNPLWKGTVSQLRLQPFYVGGWPLPEAQRLVELDYVRVPQIAALAETPAEGVELIVNGGFEELNEAGQPLGWARFCEAPLPVDSGSLKASGNAANSLVVDEARSGKHAIAVSIPGNTPEIGGWQTRVSLKPNQLYRLSFWGKRRGTDYALVVINQFKAGGERTGHLECVLKSDQWAPYRKDFMSHAETTGVQIVAAVWSQPACQAEFDDFSLTEPGLGGSAAGAAPLDTTPYHVLTRDVVTPSLAWANPWAGGPVKLLVTPTCRDVVELAQRLSVEFTTWRKFEEGDGGDSPGNAVLNDLYYGRQERTLIASYQELSAKVAGDLDVILIGQQRWGRTFSWEGLPAPLRQAMLAKVRAGAGLIYVRPSAAARAEMSAAADQELPLPASLAVGVPYAGLTVLDRDVQGSDWLKCYTLGKGRMALVDYQNEVFGVFEKEKSFRRGSSCPFTPDVTYDGRATPLEYEYQQALLAKLVLWAGTKEGPVTLTRLEVRDGTCLAEFTYAGPAGKVDTQIVVRDRDGKQEAEVKGEMALSAGPNAVSQALGPLPAGPHYADLWLRAEGKTVAWGSAYFQTSGAVSIATLDVDKPFCQAADTVRAKLVLEGAAPADMKVRIQLADSLGRILSEETQPVAGRQELGFTVSLAGAEAILHQLTVSLLDNERVIAERRTDIVCRREPALDDFTFSFWAPLQNNDPGSRYMLQDFARKGFTEAYIGYMYATPATQLEPALKATVATNLDLSFFAFSLAGWDAGSDPGATVSSRCLTREGFRQNLFNVLRQHAASGKNYPVSGYSLGDEAGITGYGQDYCFSPTCLAYLRSYLKSTYATLEALNAEWGTAFADWEAVTPMTKPEVQKHGNFAPWVDHRMAMESMFADLIREAGEAVRAVDPSGRVGTEGITGGGTYWNNGESSTTGFDFGKIFPVGQHWGLYFHFYPQIEYLRSFAPADSVRFTYTQPFEEYPNGYFRDAWTNEKVNRFVPWYDLFNGMNGTMYWGSMATDWHGFYSGDFRPTPWSQQVAETIQEIRGGIGKLLLHCRRDNSGIAIHYSPASFHVATLMGGTDSAKTAPVDVNITQDAPRFAPGGRERIESPKAFCRALEDLGLQYDFISAQQMAAGELGEYKVLVLPYSYAIGREEAEQIRAFVAAGGTVIADGTPGIMDGHGKKVDEPLLSGVTLSSCRNRVWAYNDIPRVRNGDDGGAIREEIRGLLKAAGVEAPFRIIPAAGGKLLGCEVVHFTDRGAEYLGLLQGREYLRSATENHDPVPVTISLPRKLQVYSIRDGKDLGVTDTIQTAIEPAVAQVYALLPGKVESLAVAGIKDVYERGGKVEYAVTCETAGQAAVPQVYRVEVKRPDGRTSREYGRNLYGLGTCQGTFTLALNDPAGNWTIVVTDVASAATTQKVFAVK
jgi:hypothetical protein